MATVEEILLEKGAGVIATLGTTTVQEAARRMADADVGCLIVEQDNHVIGIFTERDLLRRVIVEGRDPDATTVAEVMTSPVQTCRADDPLNIIVDRLGHHRFRHLLVMGDNQPVGVISLRDVAPVLREQIDWAMV
jgi:CBS domain-containing protein